jgi:hypothetical protein
MFGTPGDTVQKTKIKPGPQPKNVFLPNPVGQLALAVNDHTTDIYCVQESRWRKLFNQYYLTLR